ncbi:Uncharacterised protein [Vibrio cholerae]|nr:Uncharacterised protein [Vibrio cholerae]CSB71549.1 Uncharacterised protein [Vibrio cholerae]
MVVMRYHKSSLSVPWRRKRLFAMWGVYLVIRSVLSIAFPN